MQLNLGELLSIFRLRGTTGSERRLSPERVLSQMIAARHSQLCYTARMSIKKKQKPHSSARKKSSASLSAAPRAKKAASKATKSAAKSSAAKKKAEELKRRKKLEELTLKMFQTVYDDYQQGKFHRII